MKTSAKFSKKAIKPSRKTCVLSGAPVTRIMVFGTFDILHPGHVHFFKQARKLAKKPFLIVSVARDTSVRKIKGRFPLFSERGRMQLVQATGLADKVVLGGKQGHMPHILKEEPHVIALGYDQVGHYVDETERYLEEHGVPIRMVRLKPHHPEKYKSSIYKAKLKQ